jgi:hypothetical protein
MSDERLKKVFGEGRENRTAYDRAATENRELSDAENSGLPHLLVDHDEP